LGAALGQIYHIICTKGMPQVENPMAQLVRRIAGGGLRGEETVVAF
jgi:hypothetical protein